MSTRAWLIAISSVIAFVACGGGGETAAGAGGDAMTSSSQAAGGGGHAGASTDPNAGSSGCTGGSSTGGGGSSATGGGGSAPRDPCLDAHPTCPNDPPTKGGGGLKAIDRCSFPIEDADTWTSLGTIFDSIDLPKVSVADVLGDLNRTAVPKSSNQIPGGIGAFRSGFGWQSGDETVAYWTPQGLSGSADASAGGTVSGKKVLLTSWYYDKASDQGSTVEKGVRIALVDDSDPGSVHYRFALLVVPEAGSPATFTSVGRLHAGGIAWFGHYLYVVDTSHGFRVFDLDDIRRVDTAKDRIGYDPTDRKYYAHGYQYVVPQVGSYATKSACDQRFSFVSLDRTATPPELLAGEYCVAGGGCDTFDGRLFRYPLDEASGRLAAGRSFPSAAFYEGETQIQGGLSQSGNYYLSSSAPKNGKGELLVLPNGGGSKSHAWVDAPEDLLFDRAAGSLFGLSEANGARFVFAVDIASY